MNEKAVHLAFDHEKLMMVTREFAREHGLELPKGYDKGRDRDGKNKQLSLYDMHQQRTTGLTKEERMAQITDAWRASDSSKAFVQALGELGYILASGKRPYVLVDIYGDMNALPKLIGDKQVRTKDIRAFPEKDYPPESLPTVEQAQELAAKHREVIESHYKEEDRAEQLAHLKTMQTARRQKLESKQAVLRQRHHKDRETLWGQSRRGGDVAGESVVSQRTLMSFVKPWGRDSLSPGRAGGSSWRQVARSAR